MLHLHVGARSITFEGHLFHVTKIKLGHKKASLLAFSFVGVNNLTSYGRC